MQPVMYSPSASAACVDALFASMLQRSDRPSADEVRKAIAAAVRAYGGRGCAERVAQEFGDHPETAVTRMRWARAVVGEVVASPTAAVHSVVRAGRTGPGKQARLRRSQLTTIAADN